jgi:hypothetical protein
MKNLILIAGLIGTPALAQDFDAKMDFEEQSDDPVIANYNVVTDKFNEALAEIQTHEMFAGRRTEINFRGKEYVIDRSQEAVKSRPGVPARPTSLGSLVGDISARTSGSLKIKVIQEKFKDGKLESRETWEIDVGGSWQAETGMPDASGKAHK